MTEHRGVTRGPRRAGRSGDEPSREEQREQTAHAAERFVPELMGGDLIDAEHQARYRFALPHVAGKVVLDAGCGVGWGSALLLSAGARRVLGIDIDLGAVADSCRRTPSGRFAVADLAALPMPSASVDVVVCFEVLEHTADAYRTLDELVRVLRPGGLLFVSSPNPRVYPAGNPYHVHELPPDELHAGVAARLPHLALHRQHLLVSSLICADGERASAPGALPIGTWSITPLAPGHDPYSVVVASTEPLPPLRGIQALAPSHQLDQLANLAATLSEEREQIHEDHQRLVAERHQLLDEREALRGDVDRLGTALRAAEERLVDADTGLRRLTAEVASADERTRRLSAERDDAREQVAAVTRGLGAERDEAREQLAALTAQLADADEARTLAARTAADRDRLGAALLRAERDLALAREAATQATARHGAAVEQLRQAQLHGDAAHAELDRMRQTVSWRVTASLRRVRARIGTR
jgi:SAM-dependent methyltransferase